MSLRENVDDVLRSADIEEVIVLERGTPRAVVLSAVEFIRLKSAAGEPVPTAAFKSRATLQTPLTDHLGYDSESPEEVARVIRDALNGNHEAEVLGEIDKALRRWGLRP